MSRAGREISPDGRNNKGSVRPARASRVSPRAEASKEGSCVDVLVCNASQSYSQGQEVVPASKRDQNIERRWGGAVLV